MTSKVIELLVLNSSSFTVSKFLGAVDQEDSFERVVTVQLDELLIPLTHRVSQSIRQQEEILPLLKVCIASLL